MARHVGLYPGLETGSRPRPAQLSAFNGDEWSCIFNAARAKASTIRTPMPPSDRSWAAFPLDDDDAFAAYQEWLSDFGTPDMEGRDNHQFSCLRMVDHQGQRFGSHQGGGILASSAT
ncbi:hypothetical protein D3C80_1458510 [compost metagenome]